MYFVLRIAGAADTGSVYSDVSAAAHQENYWRDTNETYNRARLLFSVVPIKPVSDLRGPPGPRPQQVGKMLDPIMTPSRERKAGHCDYGATRGGTLQRSACTARPKRTRERSFARACSSAIVKRARAGRERLLPQAFRIRPIHGTGRGGSSAFRQELRTLRVERRSHGRFPRDTDVGEHEAGEVFGRRGVEYFRSVFRFELDLSAVQRLAIQYELFA